MVSNQSTYRGLSPPHYRRQTLAIFHSTQTPRDDHDNPQPATALDRKWMHRSAGDLTSSPDMPIPDPRTTSSFYQHLYRKYPYAFQHHRPEQRQTTRKVFNSHQQQHVRFDDTELYDEKLYRDPFTVRRHDLSHLTNWDKEVGHYFKNGTIGRDCMTSAEASDVSGPTKMKHINSETLNRLLNEKSPLRRRFQDGVLSTRSELDIQDYFLEKNKARSKHRKKRCRVLQRRLDKEDQNNVYAKENTPSQQNTDNANTETKLSSLAGRLSGDMPEQSRRVDVDSLVADTDLKIDTLLEKISLKMSSPESLPDSAIDIDTPSVQSFVSAGKGGHSRTNNYTELLNLNTSAINRNGASGSLENGLDFYEKELKRLRARNEALDGHPVDDEADDSDEQETVIETNKPTSNQNNSERTQDLSNPCNHSASQNQGLLQIYIENKSVSNHRKGSEISSKNVVNSNKNTSKQSSMDRSDGNMSDTSSTMESLSSDVQSVQSCVERPVFTMTGSHGDVTIATGSKGQSRDSDVDSGIGQSSSGAEVRERGRSRGRTPASIMKDNQSVLPLRSEVDCSILDEVNLIKSDHLVSLQRDHLNETDDTADGRLGIPKVSAEEMQIAERYRRTRSPSPYILTNTRRLSSGRPNSAPCLVKGIYDIHVVDISISDKPENDGKSSPRQNKTCQNIKGSSNHFDDYITRGTKNGAKMTHAEDCGRDIYRHIPKSSHRTCAHASPESAKTNCEYFDKFIPDLPREFIDDPEHNIGASEKAKYKSTVKTLPRHADADYNSSNADSHHAVTTSYERRYKPSVTSPRVQEKREKMRNKMKSKSEGSLNGTGVRQSPVIFDTERPAGILTNGQYPSRTSSNKSNSTKSDDDDGYKMTDSQYPSQTSSKKSNSMKFDDGGDYRMTNGQYPSRTSSNKSNSLKHDDDDDDDGYRHEFYGDDHVNDDIDINDGMERVNKASRGLNDMEHAPTNRVKVNADVHPNIPNLHDKHRHNQSDHYVGVKNSSSSSDRDQDYRDQRSEVMQSTQETETQPKAPPVKPARTKRKKTLPTEVNFSDYKIKSTDPGEVKTDKPGPTQMNTATHRNMDHGNQAYGEITDVARTYEGRQPSRQPDKEEEIPKSNLESSRHLSASKVSLLDKVGNLKTATKGKIKKLRKAMSLERGIDNCGVEMNPDPHRTHNKSHDNKGGHFSGPKMKKAPSLKSLASLFGKMKKKKGKWSAEEIQIENMPGSSDTSQQTGQLSAAKRQQWASCQNLGVRPVSTHIPGPVGKLLELNKDGSQIIQLFKPASGPIGFFIAKGTNKFNNGIFVSRIAETKSENSFAGLLGVGDEILQVNGHFVRDLSQEAVYSLISASPVIVMKVLPIIARKDV